MGTSPVNLYPNFMHSLGDAAPEIMFSALSSELAWERRDGAPRSEYWTNTFGRPYTYGRGEGERTYQASQPHPMVDYVRDRIKGTFGVYLEGCFLNLYKDGTDSLGWHADDDPNIDHSKPIAVITVGCGRPIEFKSKEPGSHPERVLLTPGSLLMMKPGMQSTHFHRIPKIAEPTGPRISLTYRGLLP